MGPIGLRYIADSNSGSTALGFVLIILSVAAYWAPTITGAVVRKHNLGTIAVWNFFAWFFFFPWIMAWVKVAEKPQQPTVVYAGPPPSQPEPPQS